jgi:hypothetical protein
MIARTGASLNPGFGRARQTVDSRRIAGLPRPGWSHARSCDRSPSPESANPTVPCIFNGLKGALVPSIAIGHGRLFGLG